MKADEIRHWQDAVFDQVFEAIAASEELRAVLVFKGARILAYHLGGEGRQSLDLDANCTLEFVERYPEHVARADALQEMLSRAISRYFEDQDPVRLELASIRVRPKPPRGHPRGWNAHHVELRVIDRSRPSQTGIPNLTLDIAFPESLGRESTTTINVGGSPVKVYTLERIAGEKLRAFLSSLPKHRSKASRPGDAIRVRDIYDLHQIVERISLKDEEFWRKVGHEFRAACESRGVDCAGWSSFAATEDGVRESYRRETILPKKVTFEDAWEKLRTVIDFMERNGVAPFEFPLPDPEPQ